MPHDATLVTGASGFLGKAIIKGLADKSQHAVGLDARPSATAQIIDDLSDRERLGELLRRDKITHIIHAGGVSGPMVLADQPTKIIAVNVLGSLNLLYAAIAMNVKTFIYCSSAAAHGNFHEETPVRENYPLRPDNTYSASKAAMEMVLQGLWGKIPLDLCSLRFTVIYGPGRETKFTIEEIVGAAIAGGPAHIPPMTDWPYIYIDDAARAAIQACFSRGRKQLSYFVAHPEKVTPDDIAAAAAAAGRPVRLEIDASRPKAARGPLNVEAAAHDFNFRAEVDHREGIRRLIASS